MNKIVPINQAEAIFMPLFDMNISNINAFTLIEEENKGGIFTQSWDSCVISSNAKNFSILWKGRLILNEYNAIRIFTGYPEHLLLSGKAIVNGKEHILFTDFPGGNAPVEPTSNILKEKDEVAEVTEITLTFHCTGGCLGKHNANLYWIGVLSTEKEKLIQEQLPKYNERSWDGLINLEGSPGINNNIFFTEQELAIMKSRIEEPFFRAKMDKLIEEAKKWEDFCPEKEIREYVPVVEHLYRYTRVRDRNRAVLEEPIILLAIAGYLLNNPKWAQMSARMILSIAHTPKWFEGPQGCMQGSTWHHVCFMEDHYSSAIATALGFLGDVFTQKGIEVIMDSIEKAWKWVNKSCEETGYRWFMNQGLVGNRGRIIGAYSLYKNGRGYEEYIEKSYIDHTTIVNNYLNEEGHCTEGGYYQYSFSSSVPLWIAYANYKGVDIERILPDGFINSIKYVEASISSNNDFGYSMPLGAGGYRPFNVLLLSFLASVCNWSNAYAYLKNRSKGDFSDDSVISGTDILVLLRFIPKDFPDAKVKIKGLNVFRNSGMMSYDFDKPYKGKFMFLSERNPMTGHFHEDRGSIILEANGKTLLLDLGTTNYSNPMCAFMGKKEYHNLAYPDGMDMKIINPKTAKSANEAGDGCTTVITVDDFTYTGSKLEYAEETETGVMFGCDLKPLYDDEVIVARRQGELILNSRGGTLTLRDEWRFSNKHTLNIRFLSYSPWRISANSVQSIVEDMRMTIDFVEKSGIKLNFEQDEAMVDSNLKKVYTLKVRIDEAEETNVCSTINFIKT